MLFAKSFSHARDAKIFWPYACLGVVLASGIFWLCMLLLREIVLDLFPVPDQAMSVGLFLTLALLVIGWGIAYLLLLHWGFMVKHALLAAVGLQMSCVGQFLVVASLSVPPPMEVVDFTAMMLFGGLWLFIRYFSEGPAAPRTSARQLSRRN